MSKRFSISGLGNVFRKVVPALLVAVGAFSGTAAWGATDCEGTLYFKPPTGWTQVHVTGNNIDKVVPSTNYDATTGYWTYDLSNLGVPENGGKTFGLGNSSTAPVHYISATTWDAVDQYTSNVAVNNRPFACPGAGKIIYVAEDPLNLGKPYSGVVPPDAKYFYVKVPQTADWLWSSPSIRSVGSTTGKAMTPVSGRCGWYEVVYNQAGLPASAEIYNAEGKVFGTGSLTLSTLLSDANPKLYFDADANKLEYTDPKTNGSCASSQGTKFYFLMPEDKDWQSATPMLSSNGGVSGDAMVAAPNMCGWYYKEWGKGVVPPEKVIIYRSTDEKREDLIGINGLWGDADEIPLKEYFVKKGANLYFVPDDGLWDDVVADGMGWTNADPGPEFIGICEFKLAAVIYDTDQSKNSLFSSDGESSNCVGVKTGVVQVDLGPDNKPVFGSGKNATDCGVDEGTFKSLFNYKQGVNEVQCYDMPFRHYGNDPRWGFDSDSTTYDGEGHDCTRETCKGTQYRGGFYPLEFSTDATVVTSLSPQPCSACRTKRTAQSPVPNNVGANFDKYCTTAGWTGTGGDCEGKFAEGENPAVWFWGFNDAECSNNKDYCQKIYDQAKIPGFDAAALAACQANTARLCWNRPTKVETNDDFKRNQQYCFESHATFTYREDQEFTFRGDDDIWIFINKKLVIDNGGAHLAAPGHVVLKNLNNKFKAKDGGQFLVPDKEYSLDIFFCDRRTTMSNVIIKTNMYIKQSSGLSTTASDNGDGSVSYGVCFDQSGDGSCAAVAMGATGGGEATIHACDKESLTKAGKSLKFSIMTRSGEKVVDLVSGATGWQNGGIDLSNPFSPKVNKDKITGLAPGSYRLVIDVCDLNGANCDTKARTYINFRVKGNLDVMTQDSKYVVNPGDEKSKVYENGTTWKFVGKGLGGGRVPVYVSAFADGGVDLLSAVGQKYTLMLDAGMEAYASKTGDTKITFPKVVGESGIDTVWVYQDLAGMTTSPEKKNVKLKSAAVIEFYAPKLEFATPATYDSTGKVLTWNHPITADPDKDEDGEMYYHWIGSDVDLYLLIVNPIDNTICTECNIAVELGQSSKKVINANKNGIPAFENGVTIVSIRSSLEYMDSAATITVQSSDMPSLVFVTYGNLHFREPPVPYPQLVDLFDVRGETLGKQSIPEPYFSESKDYLDGKADSIAIYYHRQFQPGPNGEYKDSLPHLICLNWDEDNLQKYNFVEKNVSTSARKDTAVQCSYTIDSVSIYNAFMARYKANGNKSDSVLTFVSDSVFSTKVKTFGDGKVLNFAAFMEKNKVNKMHFDGAITDRMAPVIVSARVDNFSDQLNRLTVTLSEPVKMVDETNKTAPFSFYMNSATEVAEAARYASPTANAAPGGVNTAKLTLVFDKTQSTKNPTPRLGDYIRFRADSRIWSDTTDISSEFIVRAAADSSMYWNSPTDYNSTKRLPSSWVNIVGDYSVEVSAIKLATMNKDIDAKNTPAIEVFTVPTTMGKDEIAKLYPNTLGFIVKSDMASFMSKDSVTEKYFNEHPEALKDVYFQYDVKFYTNLGNYVAGKSNKIYCLDEVNKQKFGKEYFGGKDCRTVQGNFYISWNMLSDKKRLVGTGAYIAKLSSFVKLAQLGKAKSSKAEETDMWGAKRGKGIVKK